MHCVTGDSFYVGSEGSSIVLSSVFGVVETKPQAKCGKPSSEGGEGKEECKDSRRLGVQAAGIPVGFKPGEEVGHLVFGFFFFFSLFLFFGIEIRGGIWHYKEKKGGERRGKMENQGNGRDYCPEHCFDECGRQGENKMGVCCERVVTEAKEGPECDGSEHNNPSFGSSTDEMTVRGVPSRSGIVGGLETVNGKEHRVKRKGDGGGGELDLIRSEFEHHQYGVARINNGSFGSCPASVLASQAEWARLFLQQPDKFYFDTLQEGLLQSRKVVASLIHAEYVEEVALVDNATTAVAVVLQHVAWKFMERTFQKGDVILMLHYAYGAVKKAIQAYAARAGGLIIEVELPFPVHSDEEIISKFREAVDRGKREGGQIRLAVIDHVSSMPSVLLPVKKLIRICREEGVDQVFVDGAHSIGNVDIDMQDIGADFYTSNLHKWFFCPPSVAFLYCRLSLLHSLHHPIVSHEFGNGFPIECTWVGTRDYSAQLCVPSVLEFLKNFDGGIDAIRKKNHDNVVAMGKMLAKAWGTHLGAPPELSSSMVMVGLPACLDVSSERDAMDLRTRIREEFAVEVPIYYRPPKSGDKGPVLRAYARISHQIYNTQDDYKKFSDAILQLVAEASQVQ